MLLRSNLLQYNDCVGLRKPERLLYATPPPYSPNTQDQTVDYGGAKWKGQPGGSWEQISGGDSGGGNVDVVGNAQKLLDFQKQANAPVAAALGSQVPGIQDQYTQLVNSIKGSQQVSRNAQTLTTANTLGGRGLTSDSGVYQQEMNNALLPVDTAYGGLLAQTNVGSIQDLQSLALQIANLNAGNPETAIPNALQYGGLQNQAAQVAASIQNAQTQANSALAVAKANPYAALGSYGVINTQTGGIDYSGLSKLLQQLGGVA